jgi:Kef-type K+ transport system membrane component KefB
MRRYGATNVVNRIVSLVLLLGLAALVLLTPVFDRGVSGGQATFCLGFILLFGYYLAKLLDGFRLPTITGYIVAGILSGPFVLNLLSPDIVTSLRLFDDLALSIIALIAGGEMRLRVIRARGRAFAAVIAGQTVFAFAAAISVVSILGGRMGDLPVGDWHGALAVALLFGLVIMARSPATTIGVITESRARGPVTEVLIGVTVLLDVVVLVMAAFLIPASELLVAPGGTFSLDFVAGLGLEIVGAIVAGVFFGFLIGIYIRWIGGYLPIFLFVIGLVGSSVCRHYHLEPLLAFMVAGFFVQNYSEFGDKLIRGLERGAFPVYVIFFAISGAAIDLGALREMWLVALVLVAARGLAFYVGSLAASSAVMSLRPHSHSLWSGFLAQAGVTIGLASLIQKRVDWGAEFYTIVLAMVAINQLIGPVLLKWLLERKRETGGMDRLAP